MTRFLVAVAAVAVVAGLAGGQTLEQILAQTGLDSDLVAMLTVEQGQNKFLLVFVYIDERTLGSNVRPEVAQAIAPYVGQNALLIWGYSEGGAVFDPGSIWFAQGETTITLSPEVLVPIEGDLASGTIPAMAPVAAVVVLGEGIDPAQPFEIHYGDVAMASMAVNVALAASEAQSQASVEVQAQAEATAQATAQAQATVQAQGLGPEPCGPCTQAEPCPCDPCAWLSQWWCCPQEGCDPCDPCRGGLIVPFLLLLLLGL